MLVESKKFRSYLLPLGISLWLAVTVAGMKMLFDYSSTAGSAGEPQKIWPQNTSLGTLSAPALVMVAHPQCPCTRASIAELSKIMSAKHPKVKAYVLFWKPKGMSQHWVESDLWNSAGSIPGVSPVPDDDGQIATRFGISTSGHTLLYTNSGELVFSGGITAARGHEGDNRGEDLILHYLNGGSPTFSTTPAFGCPITNNTGNRRV